MTAQFTEHDQYVTKLNAVVHAGRDDLIEEIAEEFERHEPSGRAAFWSTARSGWVARTLLDAGEPPLAGPAAGIEGSIVLRLPIDEVSSWDRRDLLRD
jgi:hypothetical protein